MYMTPTAPAGGVLCSIHASAHLPAFASKHIGSGPGVAGLSGMQVQPLVPLRSVFIAPLASAVMMVALPETEAGAADCALAINAASPLCAVTAVGPIKAAAVASSNRRTVDIFMEPLHRSRGRTRTLAQ